MNWFIRIRLQISTYFLLLILSVIAEENTEYQQSPPTGIAKQNWYLPLGQDDSLKILHTHDKKFVSLVNRNSVGLLHVPDLGYRFKNTLQPDEFIRILSRNLDLITVSSFNDTLYYGLWESTRGSSLQRIPLDRPGRDSTFCEVIPNALPDADFQALLLIDETYVVLVDYESIQWSKTAKDGYDTVLWGNDMIHTLSSKGKRLKHKTLLSSNGTMINDVLHSIGSEIVTSIIPIGNNSMPWVIFADKAGTVHIIRLTDGMRRTVNSIVPTFVPEDIRSISSLGNGSVLEALIHTKTADFSVEIYDAPFEELSASVIMLPELDASRFNVSYPDLQELDDIYALFRLVQEGETMTIELIALDDGSVVYAWELKPMFPSTILKSFVQVIDVEEVMVYFRLVGIDADGAIVSYDNLPDKSVKSESVVSSTQESSGSQETPREQDHEEL